MFITLILFLEKHDMEIQKQELGAGAVLCWVVPRRQRGVECAGM